MKNIYTISLLLCIITLTNCSKDFLKKYDKRIVGTWQITNVNRFGLGGDIDNLPFTDGTFNFYDDGTLDYLSTSNGSYQGHWDIVKKTIDDETVHTLQITAVNFTTQDALSQYYDEMNFTSTDHFNARSYSGLHAYVTSFRR